MRNGKKIKVIKRAERTRPQATPSKKSAFVDKRGESKRDAVSVVTGWISELRRKRVAEGLQGFESLFGKAGRVADPSTL